MKVYYVVGISFSNSFPDRNFSVFCRSPQEAIDIVCSRLANNGYYYQKDYLIEFCAVKCSYNWTVQKRFRAFVPDPIPYDYD